MSHYVMLVPVAVLAVLLCVAFPSLGAGGDPARGKLVYEKNCLNCHGPKGKGDGPVGKMLQPPPANLTSAATKKKSEEALLNVIRNGKPPTAMIGWQGSLSDQEINDVLAYIRQLP